MRSIKLLLPILDDENRECTVPRPCKTQQSNHIELRDISQNGHVFYLCDQPDTLRPEIFDANFSPHALLLISLYLLLAKNKGIG